MLNIKFVILVVVFVLLLTVILQVVKSGFDFGKVGSVIVSVCVTLLAIIGMDRFLAGHMEIVLLPYMVFGIVILTVLLFRKYCKRCDKGFEKKGIMRNDNHQRS